MSTPVRHDHEHSDHQHEHETHEHEAHEHEGHEHEHAAHEHSDHQHEHGTPAHAHAAEVAPASNDNLILDIGADTGALIIHAAPSRDQAEVEISPAGHPRARSHNIVRRRETVGGATYAAVFPALTAGDYIVWGNAHSEVQAGLITIRGGTVASFRLDQG